MDKTSVIEISNLGPVTYREIPVPPGGGVVVLKGRNGAGKTITLNAARTALGADLPLPRRDEASEGSVTIGDTSVRMAKRLRRVGASPNELEIVHLEDQYDISQLVDPGLKDETAADGVRIKALVQLSGVPIDWQEFVKLIPPSDDPNDTITLDDARDLGDPVAIAAKVKRIFDAEALRIERLAEKELTEKAKCEDAIKGIDLKSGSDRAKLQETLSAAIAAHSKLVEQKEAHDRAAAVRKEAERQLGDAATSYAGPTVAEAEDGRSVAVSRKESCAAKVADLESQLRDAKAALSVADADLKAADASLAAAKAHRDLLAKWDASLATELPPPPSEDDLSGAEREVKDAEAAVELGIRVRAAIEKKSQAEKHGEAARKLSRRAQQLRSSAGGAEDLLSKAVKSDELAVKGGRLVYTGGAKEEPYARLSDGQRWRLAIRIGAERVSERTGDGTRLMVLPQRSWESLDPTNRAMIQELALEHGITILTAECADGDLRAEVFGEDKLAEVALSSRE